MNRSVSTQSGRHRPADADTDGAILRKYYSEHSYLTSPEGIMKVIAVILCVSVSAALLVPVGGSCAAPLRGSAAALELVCAAALLCLLAARALRLATHAPLCCLLADLIISTVIGILLLVTAVLGLALCELGHAGDYIHGPLGIVAAGITTGSAAVTYASAARRWDRRAGAEPPGAPPTEQDV